jgi:hypothetical protein
VRLDAVAAERCGRAKERFRRTSVGTLAELRRAKTIFAWIPERRTSNASHSHKLAVGLLGQYTDSLDMSFFIPSSTAEDCS